MGVGVQVPPRTRQNPHTAWIRINLDFRSVGFFLVGDLETECAVDRRLSLRGRSVKRARSASTRGEQLFDVVGCDLRPARSGTAEDSLGLHLLGFDVRDPPTDNPWITPLVERLPVPRELALAVPDSGLSGTEVFGAPARVIIRSCRQTGDGVVDSVVGEQRSQPAVQIREDVDLALADNLIRPGEKQSGTGRSTVVARADAFAAVVRHRMMIDCAVATGLPGCDECVRHVAPATHE